MAIKANGIFLLSFFVSLIFAPLIVLFCKKIKANQTILNYVTEHKDKQGTQTMGGLIFIVGIAITSMIFIGKDSTLAFVSIGTMLAFCVLGFLDDFIKIKFHQNEGLKPYQKIVGQVGISTIIGYFCYTSNLIPNAILIPFSGGIMWNIGVFIIPFVIFVFLAIVNSVNLLDGLDGLCGGVSLINCVAFGIIIFFGQQSMFLQEQFNLALLCFASAGAIFCYLLFNIFPAKIFMGDTGSLALGGLISCFAIFSGKVLYILFFGMAYVITAISVILQVLHYKRTKKRLFLMAPIHHHFQKKGVHENKIVFIYIVSTVIICAVVILIAQFLGV
ncbi:MAG: phospho-N-acetylmuramoyl-pentapeptide-transferase [Clostridia bacterium]